MRNIIYYLIFLGFCLSSCSHDQPNILWFVSEDNSPYLGAYGDELVKTPALDQLAKEGILFTNAFSNAPVCAPSRSTIITGMYPPTMGSENMRSTVKIDTSIRFFPQYLKQVGYFTTLRLKRDYNIPGQEGTWDIDDWWHLSDAFAGRKEDQPFFMFYNTWMTHEGRIHDHKKKFDYFQSTFERLSDEEYNNLKDQVGSTDPALVALPDYLPDLPEVRKDLALYYDNMKMLDLEFAHVIRQLEELGELENTIIIYSSDHGGVCGRSKRFTFESGLHVPLIVRYPKKYKHLSPGKAGSNTDRLVSFVDMAPTILNLAGADVPAYMQGENFLDKEAPASPFEFGFRGRMDESYDMVRTIRNKQYRYIRNYYPHRPGAQHITFLWKAPNVQAWEKAYQEDALNPIQQAWFLSKSAEELYDCVADPDNVVNLINDPAYQEILIKMRTENSQFIREIKDIGFIPEGELYENTDQGDIPYVDYAGTLPLNEIISAAENATSGTSVEQLLSYLNSEIAAIRFWGAMGCLIQQPSDPRIMERLKIMLSDISGDVQAAVAEALFYLGEKDIAIKTIGDLMSHSNPYVVLRVSNAIEATGIDSEVIREKITEYTYREDDKSPFNYVKRKCTYLN